MSKDIFTQKLSKETPTQKYPQRYLLKIYQIISEEKHIPNNNSEKKTYLPKIFEEKSLPKNLCRETCIYPKSQNNNYRPIKL